MGKETERKFLVAEDYRGFVTSSERIAQGYLSSVPERTVRVRIKGERGFITVKGAGNGSGVTRFEWEKEIPADEAAQLLELCGGNVIEKIRHKVPAGKHVFEVDEFLGRHAGLTVAEIELESEDEEFERPCWLGREVTGDIRYYNSYLAAGSNQSENL